MSAELDALVEEYLDRTARGEEAEAVVRALCAEQPALAEGLRLRLDLLRRVGLLSATPSADPPERLGEFRILSRLGGGGMGVVYLAEQEGLGRVVALKVIHPAQLHFGGARERFLREVQVIARLQHPGIVPVHAVGEQAGVPYFAMERVPGRTLEELLDQLRPSGDAPREGGELASAVSGDAASYVFAGTWEQACLRVVAQVADALHHAHQRGVVHRDVKPSNVMLTPEGRALLLDFGLAGSEGAATLTAAGSPLGSLPYMSPEQARGERVDARSDVYSLGVTLYELLTLRRAFDASSARVLTDIEQGRRPPPRQIAPHLSWEAETVCLTAMDPDPERRYATAGDLARDLLNVLDHRPIEARRASPWLRARRWAQRRPAAAVALLAALLLVVGGPTVFALQQRRYNLRLQTQQAATLASLRQALRALDSFTRLGGDELEYVPQMEPLRARLLEEALVLSGQLDLLAADDPHVLGEALDLQVQIADLHVQRGEAELALEAGRAALERARQLGAEASPARRAAAHAVCSKALKDQGHFQEAADEMSQALAVIEGQPALTLKRAQCWLDLASIQLRFSLADAEQSCRTGLALLEGDPDPKAAMWSAVGSDRLANALQLQHKTDEALPHARSAIAGLEAACASEPSWIEPRVKLVVALNNQALVLSAVGQRDEALAALRRAVDLAEKLAADFPGSTLFSFSLAKSASMLGNRLAETGRIDEALAEHARARELLTDLSAAHPESASYAQELARLCANDSLMLWGRQPPDLAAIRALADQAIAQAESLLASEPDVATYENILSTALVSRGGVERAEDDLPAARLTFEAAAAHGRRAIELQPDRRSFHASQVQLVSELGQILHSLGEREALIRAAEELRATLPGHPQACAGAARLLAFAGDPRVIEWLTEAVALGFPAAKLADDPAFASLQSETGFQALLAGSP